MLINTIILSLLAISIVAYCIIIGKRLKNVIKGADLDDVEGPVEKDSISFMANTNDYLSIETSTDEIIKNKTIVLRFEERHLTANAY